MRKEIAIIGLGKMGKNMRARLRQAGWKVLAFDKNPALEKLVKGLARPRAVWLMVPAGKPVDEVIKGLVKFLQKDDIIIDGGNSFYEDSIKRGKILSKKGINFMDVGVSGGPEGARKGACIMVGGKKSVFDKLKPLFRDLAQKDGFQYVGRQGAGHFVKMVHNGIEYGMMQALAEGFNLMKKSRFGLNLKKVAELYNHGSVIESRLLFWLEQSLARHGENLGKVSGRVGATGEGEWTVKVAKKKKVPVRVIEEAVNFRKRSQKKPDYTGKILSALREQFGGHSVK